MLRATNLVTRAKVARYEGVVAVFKALFNEVKDLGRQMPESALSSGAVARINRVLVEAQLVAEGEPEAKYCDLLDDAGLTHYADATLIMAQHDGALTAFLHRHSTLIFETAEYEWYFDDLRGDFELSRASAARRPSNEN